MCARLIGVPAGKPVRFAVNDAVADVMFPEASFMTLSVMVAVPAPADSAPVTGGVSSDGLSAAVKVYVAFAEGELGELLSEHAPNVERETTSAHALRYFIVQLL